jgi:myo-inositol-1(or 4)-monophosphatase
MMHYPSMLKYFHEIYQQVREYLVTKGQFDTAVVQVNPKGDKTKAFDYKTEEIVLDYFNKHLPFPVKVLTEERGEVLLGSGSPEYTLILDPVDGSDNFTRRLGMTSFSVAAIPMGDTLTIDNVQYGLVGHLFLDKVFTAEKGKGAYCNDEKIRTSRETDLRKSLLSAYILGKKQDYLERVYPLLRHITNLRCFGTAAYELCQVAAGGLESYIDVRNLCTSENFMAAAMMIQEAGGIVSDERGEKLMPIPQLDYGYNIIASGNRELHDTILKYLSCE